MLCPLLGLFPCGEESGGDGVVVAIFGDDFEEVEEGPFFVDTLGFGGEFGEEVSEGEGLGGVAVGGETALDGVGDGDGVVGNGGGEATGEDVEGVAEAPLPLQCEFLLHLPKF